MRAKDVLSVDDREKYARELYNLTQSAIITLILVVVNIITFLELYVLVDTNHPYYNIFIFTKMILMLIGLYFSGIMIINVFSKGKFTYDVCFKIANKTYLDNISKSKKTTTSD